MYDNQNMVKTNIEPAISEKGDSDRFGLTLALVGFTFLVVGILLGYLLLEPLFLSRMKDSVDEAVRENMLAIEETISEALSSGELRIEEGVLAASVRAALAEERAAEEAAALAPLYEGWEDDPSFGPEDASVIMIEFSDFRCSYCGVFANETLPRIRAEYEDRIRFVYRDFPIFGELSLWAALGGQCALEQGDFWKYHDALFLRNAEFIDASFLTTLAGELGYEVAEFETCIQDPIWVAEIQQDYQAAQSLSLQGTPGFYINGKFLSGAQPYETFAILLDAALADAEAKASDS